MLYLLVCSKSGSRRWQGEVWDGNLCWLWVRIPMT